MSTRTMILFVAAVAGGLLLGLAVDERAYHAFRRFGEEHESSLRDWVKFTWLIGFLPLWLIVAAGIGLGARGSLGKHLQREAWTLVAACTASGIATYLAKILIRRERPGRNDGEYGFRAYSDRLLSDSGLGLPSGHTCLAFAAAFSLTRICPRARVLWYGLATGCALNRLVEGRHFVSDVCVGACLGWLVSAWVWSRLVPNAAGTA